MTGAATPFPLLDEQQKKAVERIGQDVCVVAGPGSGKTRVLVERFAWLVAQGVDPEKILAITFTEKAANEIRSRLAKRFAHLPDKRAQIERAQISTIHGFCHALLRHHALRAGLDPRFEVLDDTEAQAHRHAAMQRVLDRVAEERKEEFLRLAAAWPAEKMASALLDLHEAIRVAGGLDGALDAPAMEDPAALREEIARLIDEATRAADRPNTKVRRQRLEKLRELQAELASISPLELRGRLKDLNLKGTEKTVSDPVKTARDLSERLLAAWAAREFAPQRALVLEILRRFDAESRQIRKTTGAVDFTDLEEFALQLLENHRDIRMQAQESFEYVLMDELQDTNPIQWKIVGLIRRPGRFFAVGDINQSIYGFRHAEPQLFERFEESMMRAGLEVDRLETNYRTRPEILDAVTRILLQPIWENKGIRSHELRPGSQFEPGEPPFVEILCSSRKEGDEADVNLWLAARLRELYGRPLSGVPRAARFSDMAIFVRNLNSFAEIENALARFSIPYVISGGKTFFEATEVIDLLNLLRAIADPGDEIAAFALLRSPLFGVSDEEIFRRRIGGELLRQEERNELDALRRLCSQLPVSAALARFLDEHGYWQCLSPLAAANAAKFLRMLEGLEGKAGRDAAALLEEVEVLRKAAREANAPVPEAFDAVQVMTIHKAKGLEFPIVAVAALQKGEKSDTDPALYDAELGLGFKWRADSGQTVEDPVFRAIEERRRPRSAAERDRLLYVALTRAKERLILAFTDTERPRGDWHKKVLAGLGLAVPAEPGASASNDLAMIRRVVGEPAVPPAPEVSQPAPSIEMDRLTAAREAPSRVSVTALALFAQCPRRYLLDSALGWPAFSHGGGGALELGTEVHEFLAGIRDDVSPEARQLAEVFRQSALARRASNARACHREMDFLEEVDGTLLHGQIDLWFDEGAGPVIVDYKTDQYLSEARLRGYELQVRLYALALERITGRSTSEAWLFPLREGQPHPVDLSPAALAAARQTLQEWREASTAGDFPPREQPDCQWCPFAGGACPVRPIRGDHAGL